MTFIAAVGALWIMFYCYWLVSAIGVKKAVRATPWWKGAGVRLLLVIAAVLLTRLLRLHRIFFEHPSSLALNIIGLVLCVTGLALAVWARLNLGRNWGTPMSLKEGHELVTTGPYRYVRHPIYTGILLALVGTGLVAGVVWLFFFVIICPCFDRRLSKGPRYPLLSRDGRAPVPRFRAARMWKSPDSCKSVRTQ